MFYLNNHKFQKINHIMCISFYSNFLKIKKWTKKNWLAQNSNLMIISAEKKKYNNMQIFPHKGCVRKVRLIEMSCE